MWYVRPMTTPWTRPNYTGSPISARVASLAVFKGAPPADIDLDLGFATPSYLTGSMRVQSFRRGEHPSFETWLGPDSIRRAHKTLGASAASTLASATGGTLVLLERPDPSDLSHLQVQWAFRAAMDQHGALAHLDLISGAWLPRGQQSPAFDPRIELATIFSARPVPEAGLPVFTQGLRKLGQPDLISFASSPSEAPFFHALLRSIGAAAATGTPLAPGATFNDGHSARYRVQPFEPSNMTNLPQLPDPLVRLVRISMSPDA